MQVKLESKMVDLEGKELKNDKGNLITLRTIAIEALLAVYQDEPKLSGEEKLKRWELAVKVRKANDPAELAVEEVALIKGLVGKAYNPLIVGQVWSILK